MAETEGVVGLGAVLSVAEEDSPSDFTAVGEVKDISVAGKTVEFAEFTHQQSDSGYREYKPTFKNSGDITFKCNWTDDAGQKILYDAYEASDVLYFQLEYPNEKTHTFQAYVSNLGYTSPLNGPLEVNVTLRVTGPITEA